jgi:alpha-beta hydrolase superfamily lysophospholipase
MKNLVALQLLGIRISCYLGLVFTSSQCSLNEPPKLNVGLSQGRSEARRSLNDLRGGEFFVYSSQDGAELGAFRHVAVGRRKKIVILLHGLQTHAGWMAPVAKRLAAEGMEVWCPDRRGSGVNAAGHFAAGDLVNWRIWVDDIRFLVDTAARKEPNVPIVLVGYSWGGVMAAAYLAEVGDSGSVSQTVALAPGWAAIKPGLAGTTAILCASAILPSKRIYLPTPENVAVTDLGKAVLWEDDLLMRQVTLRYLRQMFLMQRHTNQSLSSIRVPITVLLAEKDALIDNQKIETLVQQLGQPPSRCETIPDAGHLLVQEQPGSVAHLLLQAIAEPSRPKQP